MATPDKSQVPGIDKLFNAAIERGASDLHLKPGYHPILRIQGNLIRLDETVKLTPESLHDIARGLLKGRETEFYEKGNLDSSFEYFHPNSKQNRRFRVNYAMADHQPYISFRLVPKDPMKVEDVGFPFDVWEDILKLKRGLVLVTGVTGSGKTTTQASLIQRINETRSEHIVTIEDPVEYRYVPDKSMFSQRELGIDVKSFADGVKFALRQDPDIMLIGEIRDHETALKCLEAAATGHLVFSTLHTKNAPETVMRYVNLFPTDEHDNIRDALAANLQYVLSQQLIPYVKGGKRVLAMEVMNVGASAAIKNHIRKAEYHQIVSDMQTGRAGKNILMDMSLKLLAESDTLDREVARTYAHKPHEF